MKNNVVFQCIGICALAFSSCKNIKNHTEENAITTISIDSLTQGNLLSNMNCKYVKLESNPDCMIGEIKRIVKDDTILFISDTKGNLYQFNTEGDYLRTISSKGNAKNEYIEMIDFFVQPETKQVSIIDFPKCGLLQYSYDNEFVSRKPLPQEIFHGIHNCYFDNFHTLIFPLSNRIDNLYNYLFYDFSTEQISKFIPFIIETKKNSNSLMHPVCHHKNESWVIGYLSDTIYTWSDNNILPKYVIDFNKKHLTQEDFGSKAEEINFNFLNKMKDKNISQGLSSIFSTDSILYIEFCDVFYKSITYNIYTHKGKLSGYDGLRSRIIYSDRDCFIGCMSMEALLEQYKSNSVMINNQNNAVLLEKIINKSEIEDNPILAIYSHEK